jgi:hypothetical protein
MKELSLLNRAPPYIPIILCLETSLGCYYPINGLYVLSVVFDAPALSDSFKCQPLLNFKLAIAAL